jgi:hypothetical protein
VLIGGLLAMLVVRVPLRAAAVTEPAPEPS